jgi:hypothetical protein
VTAAGNFTCNLPENLAQAVQDSVQDWELHDKVKRLWARDDFQVLADRNRRALRVHLGADVTAGLAMPRRAIAEVVS